MLSRMIITLYAVTFMKMNEYIAPYLTIIAVKSLPAALITDVNLLGSKCPTCCCVVSCSLRCSRVLSMGLARGQRRPESTQAPLISTQCGTSPFDFLF